MGNRLWQGHLPWCLHQSDRDERMDQQSHVKLLDQQPYKNYLIQKHIKIDFENNFFYQILTFVIESTFCTLYYELFSLSGKRRTCNQISIFDVLGFRVWPMSKLNIALFCSVKFSGRIFEWKKAKLYLLVILFYYHFCHFLHNLNNNSIFNSIYIDFP